MVLKTFDVNDSFPIKVQPLTPESFAKFGDIISAKHQIQDSSNNSSSANYGTAIKIHKVSRITNNFNNAPSNIKPTANFNIFRCSPPNHLITRDHHNSSLNYLSKVLERHPYSSQTFLPMGVDKSKDAYVVICAQEGEDTLPDITTIEAFICKGDQAVTYGAGTWHAPMISLVDSLDFAVMIHENGILDDDCQECYLDPGINIIIH